MQREHEIHWPSAWQFGLSLLALLLFWSLAGAFALGGVATQFDGSLFLNDPAYLFLLAASSFLIGLLLLPSAGFALLRLLGRANLFARTASWLRVFRPSILIFAFPVVVFLGDWAANNTRLNWIFLPPLHLLAIGLPILWLTFLGIRGLSAGSHQRNWGALGSGLAFSPVLILALELAAVGSILLLAAIYISSQPQLVAELTNLAQRLTNIPPNPRILSRILSPYLLHPVVILTTFTFIAVIVPLVEELIKPLGTWFLAGSNPTPAAGFAAGLLSGAGYSLFESLFSPSGIENWSLLVIARSGTSVMHIFTAGLTGWALAYAWRSGKYQQLGLAYLTAVLIHALWNGLTLLATVAQLVPAQQLPASLRNDLAVTAPLGLGVLAITNFGLLLYFNWKLRREETVQVA